LIWLVDKSGAPKHIGSIMRIALSTVIIVSFGSWPISAFACILCHSEPAASVRERLLQPDLVINALAVALPLALLAWVVALVAGRPLAGGRTP
jgi:hypothetical protein